MGTGGSGKHLVADFWDCRLPDSEIGWRRLIESAVAAMDATLLGLHVHLFEPQGATAVAILSESHLAVHTWPERDYVAVDVFTCGESVRPEDGIETLRRELQPSRERILEIDRGASPSASIKDARSDCASDELVPTSDAGGPAWRSL